VAENQSTSSEPQASATIPEPDPKKHYFWGTGRRKTSVARVRIRPGSGKFEINKRAIESYFTTDQQRNDIVAPLQATETLGKVDVFVNVRGGGPTGQAGAIVLGVARALKTANAQYEDALRNGGYLTRDSRMVERKKYGRAGARRSFQFSKR
jgi:small subunit ribosomal protein S9